MKSYNQKNLHFVVPLNTWMHYFFLCIFFKKYKKRYLSYSLICIYIYNSREHKDIIHMQTTPGKTSFWLSVSSFTLIHNKSRQLLDRWSLTAQDIRISLLVGSHFFPFTGSSDCIIMEWASSAHKSDQKLDDRKKHTSKSYKQLNLNISY